MRILAIILISFILIACSKDDGVSDQTKSSNPSPSTDYSKVQCGEVTDCAIACFVHKPVQGEAKVKSDICVKYSATSGGENGAACSSVIAEDNKYLQSNASCQRLKVTEVINSETINTQRCENDLNCRNLCLNTFQFLSDSEIESKAAAGGYRNSGRFLIEVHLNHLVATQLEACFLSPKEYILSL